MRVLALSLVLIAGPALADSIAKQGDDWVRITANACTDAAVLQHIPDEKERLDYRAASAYFQGQIYSACWKPLMEQRRVWLQYSDGDSGVVPFADLKPAQDV